jgi:hypothetical protein
MDDERSRWGDMSAGTLQTVSCSILGKERKRKKRKEKKRKKEMQIRQEKKRFTRVTVGLTPSLPTKPTNHPPPQRTFRTTLQTKRRADSSSELRRHSLGCLCKLHSVEGFSQPWLGGFGSIGLMFGVAAVAPGHSPGVGHQRRTMLHVALWGGATNISPLKMRSELSLAALRCKKLNGKKKVK